MASTDSLTGLGDQEAFQAALGSARRRTEVAVVLVDVDGLDEVVEARGHQAADRRLLGIAARLSSVLRTGDQMFRLDLDAFAVIIAVRDEHEAPAVAQRIAEAATQPAPVRVTVGVAVPHTGESETAVLARAVEALDFRPLGR
jgi:diguanylate cyclase (GGDEF)-like protein